MFNWFLRLFGKAPIMTHAEIMAPLHKNLQNLKDANARREEAMEANKAKVEALMEANNAHEIEISHNTVTATQLNTLLGIQE